MSELETTEVLDGNETDFLTPQQRLGLIAEVLAAIAVRMAKERSEL